MFNEKIDIEEKQNIVKKILEKDKQGGEEVKNKFYLKSEDVLNLVNKDLLSVLLSAKSIKMFKRFVLSTYFLKISMDTQLGYIHVQKIIRSLKVINDTVECEKFYERVQ